MRLRRKFAGANFLLTSPVCHDVGTEELKNQGTEEHRVPPLRPFVSWFLRSSVFQFFSLLVLLWTMVYGRSTAGAEGLLHVADAMESTTSYLVVQGAFLQEDFSTAATLAQTFLSQYPNAQETPRVRLWLALSLDRLQRSGEALHELDRLKSHLSVDDPLWPELLFWDGDISQRSLQLVRAQVAYHKLLDRHPQSTWSVQATMGLGLILLQQQAVEEARGYFHEVARQRPTTSAGREAMLLEGVCLLKLKRFQEAVDLFQSVLDHTQEPALVAQAAFYVGEGLSGLARYSEAEQAYQRVLSSAGDSRWAQLAQFALGWMSFQQGRCQESLLLFDRYLSQPTNAERRAEALFAKGSCLMHEKGREAEGRLRLEDAIALVPGHPIALESGLALVDADRQEGQLARAQELAQAMLRWPLDADSRAKIHLRLGALALDHGDATTARTFFARARERDEPSIRQAALAGLGDVQMFLGDGTQAQATYEAAVACAAHGPLAAYATFQLGRLRLQEGSLEEATDIFQQLTRHPDPAVGDEARLALAVTFLTQGAREPARFLLDEIRRQRPATPVAARSAYYQALLALGEGEETAARRFCEEVLREAPDFDEAIDAQLLLADLTAHETSWADALAWLKEVYHSRDPWPRRHQAKLAKRLGDLTRGQDRYAEAIRWYEEAVALLPAFGAEVAYRVASCYEAGGDVELALGWYQRAEQPPWSVRGQMAAAKLLERQNRVVEAQAIYRSLAQASIPEAKVAQEWLAQAQAEATTVVGSRQ